MRRASRANKECRLIDSKMRGYRDDCLRGELGGQTSEQRLHFGGGHGLCGRRMIGFVEDLGQVGVLRERVEEMGDANSSQGAISNRLLVADQSEGPVVGTRSGGGVVFGFGFGFGC